MINPFPLSVPLGYFTQDLGPVQVLKYQACILREDGERILLDNSLIHGFNAIIK